MASPPHTLLPGDHLNFSFSPTSPSHSSVSLPLLSPSEERLQPQFTLFATSAISPSLFSTHTSETLSIAQNLGPGSPGVDDPMEGSGKRGADSMMEDEQRRGPVDSDTPGGDCKSLCVRHQRMANGGTNLMLQKSIENLPPHDQTAVNTIWSLFSGSPSRRRLLILRGLLTIACPSQLTFLQDMLTLEMRLDPLIVLPREVSLKVFCYLDAISLGRAAQVSKVWKNMADDDLLWRTMCEQHIEKKCEKCGWGLPLLGERRRKARGAINALPAKVVEKASKASEARRLATPDTNATTPLVPRAGPVDLTSVVGTELVESRSSSPPHDHDHVHVHEHDHDHEHTHAPTPSTSSSMTLPSPMLIDSHGYVGRSAKRAKTESPAPSRSSTPAPGSPRPSRRSSTSIPPVPSTRPWKSVYCERLAIERNWRRGTCVATVLEGHTDSITCLQVAEDLPHPSFPVLMTGSWDRSVRIWNLETGKEVGILRGHTRGVRALQFDALKLVTGSMDSTLKIWNWRTGECVRTLRGHRDAVICLAYDKQLLVSGSADATIRVWDFGTGEVYTLRGHTEWVNSVAIWDSKAECDGKEAVIEGDMGAPTSDPEAAKKSCKGKFLFSASDDMTIRVWDLYKRTCVRVLTGHVAQVQSLRITTSEDQAPAFPTSALHPSTPSLPLASASSATTPNPRPTTTDPIDSAEVMEQNRHQVVAGNAYLGFFDAPTSDSTCAAPTPMGTAHALAASHPAVEPAALAYLDWEGDKKPCIISASLDNTIKVWDVEGGVCQRTLFGHIEGVWDVDVDKLRIVSASHDRTLKIWDKESGRCLHTLVGHTSAVTAVTLHDQYVITGGDDSHVRIWNFARNQ